VAKVKLDVPVNNVSVTNDAEVVNATAPVPVMGMSRPKAPVPVNVRVDVPSIATSGMG
jgi:hypothetical protein